MNRISVLQIAACLFCGLGTKKEGDIEFTRTLSFPASRSVSDKSRVWPCRASRMVGTAANALFGEMLRENVPVGSFRLFPSVGYCTDSRLRTLLMALRPLQGKGVSASRSQTAPLSRVDAMASPGVFLLCHQTEPG